MPTFGRAFVILEVFNWDIVVSYVKCQQLGSPYPFPTLHYKPLLLYIYIYIYIYDIYTQDGTPLKLVDKFTYLGSTFRIVSSIGELLLLIYKSGFKR